MFWESFHCYNFGTKGLMQVGVSAKCTSPNEHINQIENWKCHNMFDFRLIPYRSNHIDHQYSPSIHLLTPYLNTLKTKRHMFESACIRGFSFFLVDFITLLFMFNMGLMPSPASEFSIIILQDTGLLKGLFPDFSIIFLCHQSVDIHIRILNPKF